MELTYRKTAVKTASATGGPSTWDEASRSVEVIGASENPVEVFDQERWEVVREVLLMSGLQMPAGAQVPLLDAHSRYSTASVVGSYRGLRLAGGQLVGRAYFSGVASVQETAAKVQEGHITDFSAGYRVLEAVWVPDGQKQTIAGRVFAGPVRVTTKWQIKELSVVPIGADEFSKSRSFEKGKTTTMENQNIETEEHVRPRQLRREVEQATRNEMREIIAIGESHNMRALADAAIRNGRSLKEFKDMVLEEMGERGARQVNDPGGVALIGLSQREAGQYNFLRAIRYLADPKNSRARAEAAFEIECSQAVEDRTRRAPKGLLVPTDVLRHDHLGAAGLQRRDMSTKTGAAGGYLVGTQVLGGSFIESLENALIVKELGAIILRDLVGDLAIPKQTGGSTCYWIGEGNDIDAESQAAIGQVALRPKTVGSFTDITRKLIIQSSIDAEAFVRNELALRLALGIDAAALAGTGANGQPLGILATTGIGSVTLATANTPTHGEICDLWSQIAVDNALVGSLAYAAGATIAGKMMQTPVDVGSGRFVLQDGRLSNGYSFMMSNAVTAKYLLYGNWRDLVIGEWSGVDINVDTATLSKSGGVRVVALQDVDVAVRHAESFAYGYKA